MCNAFSILTVHFGLIRKASVDIRHLVCPNDPRFIARIRVVPRCLKHYQFHYAVFAFRSNELPTEASSCLSNPHPPTVFEVTNACSFIRSYSSLFITLTSKPEMHVNSKPKASEFLSVRQTRINPGNVAIET